jgi:hypothetical protein
MTQPQRTAPKDVRRGQATRRTDCARICANSHPADHSLDKGIGLPLDGLRADGIVAARLAC